MQNTHTTNQKKERECPISHDSEIVTIDQYDFKSQQRLAWLLSQEIELGMRNFHETDLKLMKDLARLERILQKNGSFEEKLKNLQIMIMAALEIPQQKSRIKEMQRMASESDELLNALPANSISLREKCKMLEDKLNLEMEDNEKLREENEDLMEKNEENNKKENLESEEIEKLNEKLKKKEESFRLKIERMKKSQEDQNKQIKNLRKAKDELNLEREEKKKLNESLKKNEENFRLEIEKMKNSQNNQNKQIKNLRKAKQNLEKRLKK